MDHSNLLHMIKHPLGLPDIASGGIAVQDGGVADGIDGRRCIIELRMETGLLAGMVLSR